MEKKTTLGQILATMLPKEKKVVTYYSNKEDTIVELSSDDYEKFSNVEVNYVTMSNTWNSTIGNVEYFIRIHLLPFDTRELEK